VPERPIVTTHCFLGGVRKEETMPIFIMWALPAAIVLAGGTYLIFLK
jgi:hypothetical protein